jgi:hypothetical protein
MLMVLYGQGVLAAPVWEDLSCKRAPMVQVIRDQVLNHTRDMSERIVKLTDLDVTPGSRHLNRAWVCYCCHFWKEVGT